jgi:hypothetical protein
LTYAILRTLRVALGVDVSARTASLKNDVVADDTSWSEVHLVETLTDFVRETLKRECLRGLDDDGLLTLEFTFGEHHLEKRILVLQAFQHWRWSRELTVFTIEKAIGDSNFTVWL